MSLGHSEYTLKDMSFELSVFAHGLLGYKTRGPNVSDKEIYTRYEANYLYEIELKVVATSILYRRLDEAFIRSLDDDCWDKSVYDEKYVPSLFGFNLSDGKSLVSLREAANKIIHSDSIWLFGSREYADKSLASEEYFNKSQNPTIFFVSGKKGKADWLVAIDLLAYSEDLYQVADIFANYYAI